MPESYRRFTPDDDAYIIANYATMQLRQIAANLGRHWTNVQQRRDILAAKGLLDKNARFYHRPWTEEAEDWLAEHYGSWTDAAVCKHLGRSLMAVQLKAKRLGINRRMAFWTSRNVAELFGVDAKTIIRWRDRGWIKGRRSVVTMGPYRLWHFTDEDLEQFVRELPWAYDVPLMRPGDYLTNVAKDVHQADPWLTSEQAAKVAGVHVHTLLRWCKREGLPSKQRPKAGIQAGPWQGIRLIRRADLLAWLDEYRARVHQHRSESARQRMLARYCPEAKAA